jgi:hypothetical protein
MTTDDNTESELTPDQLEAVSGGMLIAGWSWVTPTNISNAVQYLLNNPPAGW